jgi:hypothetical protein
MKVLVHCSDKITRPEENREIESISWTLGFADDMQDNMQFFCVIPQCTARRGVLLHIVSSLPIAQRKPWHRPTKRRSPSAPCTLQMK